MKLIYLAFITILAAPIFADASAYALCVKVPVANIRSGPGTHYEKAWEVYQYMPLQKVGASLSGDWYAVKDVDGDVGWIYKTLVTAQYRCATVKSKIVNVRTGPGTRYRKKFTEPVQKYNSFRILDTKGIWVKVKDEWNNIGWIHKNYLWIH